VDSCRCLLGAADLLSWQFRIFLDESSVDALSIVSHLLSAVVKYLPVPYSSLLFFSVPCYLDSSRLLEVGRPVDLALSLERRQGRSCCAAGDSSREQKLFFWWVKL